MGTTAGVDHTGAVLVPDDKRHESADLEDYEVLDGADTLNSAPGDDPLDRGIAAPQHWSAAMRFGSTAAEQQTGESLDQLLAEEEPDVSFDSERPDGDGWDENAPEEDIARLPLELGPDPRAGRLVSEGEVAYGSDEAYPAGYDDDLAQDEGTDGGGASAEEAAIHYRLDES